MQIVTIISDFGTRDHYNALLKGSILNLNANVNIVDITHECDTHDIRQASYILKGILILPRLLFLNHLG